MKNSVGALSSRVTAAEDKISELEDEMQKTSREQQRMEIALKITQEQNRKLWDDFKNRIRISGVPEGEGEHQ